MNTCRYPNAFVSGRRRMMRDAASSDILAVWKRAAPRNRMREIFTSGSVGGLAEQSLALPGPGLQRVRWKAKSRSSSDFMFNF